MAGGFIFNAISGGTLLAGAAVVTIPTILAAGIVACSCLARIATAAASTTATIDRTGALGLGPVTLTIPAGSTT